MRVIGLGVLQSVWN